MDLSIIIPVYNTKSEALKKCIDSIIQIRNIKYEIILVDDGSEEKNSKEYNTLIEKYKKNAKYFKQKNAGVSSARNLGIKEANGKYIMFIDSDDEINANRIEYKDLNDDYDIIVYNLVKVRGNNERIVKAIDCEQGKVDSNYVLRELVTKCRFYTPCAKLIRKELLEKNKIKFNEAIIHGEDAIFNLDILKTHPRIYYTDKNLYFYKYSFNTSSSRWTNKTQKMINSISKLHKEKIKLIDELEISSSELSKIYEDIIKKFFIGCMEISRCTDARKKIVLIHDELQKIKIQKKALTTSARMKFYLMQKEKVLIISILGIIRKLHLKLK